MKQKTIDRYNNFLSAIIAGIAIGLGGSLYLIIPNKFIGACCFSLGMYLVLMFKLNLFTGLIPRLMVEDAFSKRFKDRMEKILLCIITLIGNFLGASFVAACLRYSKFFPEIEEKTVGMIVSNLSKTDFILQVLLGSIMCGIIIGLIVLNLNYLLKMIFVLPLIATFILCGFPHCVATIFYSVLGLVFSPLLIIFSIIGNTIGGLFIGYSIRKA